MLVCQPAAVHCEVGALATGGGFEAPSSESPVPPVGGTSPAVPGGGGSGISSRGGGGTQL